MCEYCKLLIKNKKLVDLRTTITGYDGKPVSIRCTTSIVGKTLCLSVDGLMKKLQAKTIDINFCPMCGGKIVDNQSD